MTVGLIVEATAGQPNEMRHIQKIWSILLKRRSIHLRVLVCWIVGASGSGGTVSLKSCHRPVGIAHSVRPSGAYRREETTRDDRDKRSTASRSLHIPDEPFQHDGRPCAQRTENGARQQQLETRWEILIISLSRPRQRAKSQSENLRVDFSAAIRTLQITKTRTDVNQRRPRNLISRGGNIHRMTWSLSNKTHSIDVINLEFIVLPKDDPGASSQHFKFRTKKSKIPTKKKWLLVESLPFRNTRNIKQFYKLK